MRYRRHESGQTSEFRILDLPGDLVPAVRKAAFTAGDGYWSTFFPAEQPPGGVGPAADQPEVTDFGPVAAAKLEVVRWQSHEIRVPPLELQRAVSARRGLAERVGLIDKEQRRRAPRRTRTSTT